MSNPYQPATWIEQAVAGEPRNGSSRFCTGMGVIAAMLATPLTSLFVLAAALLMIHAIGLRVDWEVFAGDQRTQNRLIVLALVAVVVCGIAAYFSTRAATHYFAGETSKGATYLLVSLSITALILLFVVANLLFGFA